MFNNKYSNKGVLITGHTGFKGSWLAIWLKELGARVIGYALEPPSEPNNFMASGLADQITHVHGDILDINHLKKIFQEHQPEVVFHLAAQAVVRPSYENPKLTFDTNAGGTLNVLEMVRMNPCVKVLLCITSDKCYENHEWVWGYRENDPMGGHDPYSASKGCAELIFAAYLQSYFSDAVSDNRVIGAASGRAGNAMGGGDWGKDRLIPDCVQALSKKVSIGLRNARAVRPWQHVLELLSGYLWLGALLWDNPQVYSGSWNFGPDNTEYFSVREVVGEFVSAWGDGSWQDLTETKAPHEAATLILCCDKARTYLKWHNTLSMDECIRMTAAWYREYYNERINKNMYSFCVNQIQSYINKARACGLAWTT